MIFSSTCLNLHQFQLNITLTYNKCCSHKELSCDTDQRISSIFSALPAMLQDITFTYGLKSWMQMFLQRSRKPAMCLIQRQLRKLDSLYTLQVILLPPMHSFVSSGDVILISNICFERRVWLQRNKQKYSVG